MAIRMIGSLLHLTSDQLRLLGSSLKSCCYADSQPALRVTGIEADSFFLYYSELYLQDTVRYSCFSSSRSSNNNNSTSIDYERLLPRSRWPDHYPTTLTVTTRRLPQRDCKKPVSKEDAPTLFMPLLLPQILITATAATAVVDAGKP